MSEIEKEIKLPVKDMAETLAKIRSLADFGHTEYVKDVIYGAEGKKKIRLRYRDLFWAESIEVVKKFKIDGEQGVKVEVEETLYEGASMANALEILKGLGYRKQNSYEKMRTIYKHPRVQIVLDVYPFGAWIEIEGKPKDIWEVAQSLGYEKSDAVLLNADECYLEWNKKKGLKELWHIRFGLGEECQQK